MTAARNSHVVGFDDAPRPVAGGWVQSVGLTAADTEVVVRRFQLHGLVPEPLRVAHLIAGGVARSSTTQRV